MVGRAELRGAQGHLNAWKTTMTQRLPELAELMRLEMGKPTGDAMLEAGLAMEHIAWAAGHAGKVLGRRTGAPRGC